MTNALTLTVPSRPPAPIGLGRGMGPVLPPAITYRVTRLFIGEDLLLDRLNDGEIAACIPLVREARRQCRPATNDQIQAWMEVVALSVGQNAPVEVARNARIGLTIETCGDLPFGCWTPAARAQFSRVRGAKSAFFPTDGEVDAILRPMAWVMRRVLATLEAVLEEGRRRWCPPLPPVAEETPVSLLVGEARDIAIAHVQQVSKEWDRSRLSTLVEDARVEPIRRSVLTGRALWEKRNSARAATGVPLLPEPVSFEGYGA